MSYFCDKYQVIEKKALAGGIFSVKVKCPDAAKAAEVGQFANILADGYTLRRPISICEIDKAEGTLRFVFEVRGKGTEAISRVNEGENLDVLGPLGNGFKAPEGKKIIVVGGGIGVPPLLGIAKSHGADCTAILGFRSYDKVILDKEFAAYGAKTIVCTDDGSVGYHGVVTTPLKEEIARGGVDMVCACGPEPMIKAVVQECEANNIPCRVSLEQRMGCGVGACVVCSCMTVRNGVEHYSRVCKDGPVFDAKEVKFNG